MPATCVTGALLLAGCGGDAPPSTDTVTNDGGALPVAADDSVDLACRRDDDGQGTEAYDNQLSLLMTPANSGKTPFRCLRLLNAANLSSADREFRVVDIGRDIADGPAASRQLRIPLHEIKTKAFLRGQSLAIVSNGRQFAALEKECNAIKAAGIRDVIAVLPDSVQLSAGSLVMSRPVKKISPREFIAERSYGTWHLVNLSSSETLDWPLFTSTDAADRNTRQVKRRAPASGLERTLIVLDGDELPGVDDLSRLPKFGGQTFVLDGGLSGLQQFQAEATAMARALAQPRINERGCTG